MTSDDIDPWDLFIKMRKISKLNPRKFDGLAEKIVIQLEKQHFNQIMNPSNIKFSKKP